MQCKWSDLQNHIFEENGGNIPSKDMLHQVCECLRGELRKTELVVREKEHHLWCLRPRKTFD